MKFNEHQITNLYYNNYQIVRAYGCDGRLVYGSEPTPPPSIDGKFQYTISGNDYTIACNSSSALTRIEIISNMWYIDSSYSTSAITDAIIGDCVSTIDANCFNEWLSLSSLTIPSSVTTIGNSAFHRCEALPSLIIPSGVTVIPDAMCELDHTLSYTNIPNGVTSIGIAAYSDCLLLLDITIPPTVTSIGNQAFDAANWADDNARRQQMLYMAANRVVRCLAITPPTLGQNVFTIGGQTGLTTYPIYVPSESLNAYKTAQYWSAIADRIFPIE